MFLKKLILYSMLFNAVICAPEDDQDCSLVDCAAVDDSIYVAFIDNDNGQNLITDGSFQATQITVLDVDANAVDFEVEKDFQNQDLLVLDLHNVPIGEQTYQITLGNNTPFNFNITTFDGGEGFCCGPYTGIDAASLSGIAGEFINNGTLPIEVTVFVP